MGLMLNRPIEGLGFDKLLKQLGLKPVPSQRQIRMVSGGPVEAGRGFVLHTDDWSAEGSLAFGAGFALTASVDILSAIAAGGGPRQGLLALGYAGWAPGQLDQEIQRNSWLSVPADEALLFHEDAGTTWQAALAQRTAGLAQPEWPSPTSDSPESGVDWPPGLPPTSGRNYASISPTDVEFVRFDSPLPVPPRL